MKNKLLTYASFILIMVALGSSDSLKGIFAPLFQSHFDLSTTQVSLIITVSYLGNMFFLLVGGKLTDRYRRKTTLMASILVWMCALSLFLLTDNYICLLVGMFFAMGASTLTSTSINIVTPVLFAASPGFAVNALFFTQGIGTSGSQSLIGNLASDFTAWKTVNLILFILGAISVCLMIFVKIPEWKKVSEPPMKFSEIIKNKAFIYFVFIFGFYFIAEHGVLNWLVSYATQYLGMKMGKASNYLALFFGGITVGRLVLSPLIDKLGALKSIRIFSIVSGALYICGILFSSSAIFLLGISGFFMAIIYPTLVMSIQLFFPRRSISTVTGMIISAASAFDILFNLLFGKLIDSIGYQRSFLILPASMAAFVLLFYFFSKKNQAFGGFSGEEMTK